MMKEQAEYELLRAIQKIQILEHTLGNKTHYRNHYAAGPEHTHYPLLCELVDAEYMKKGAAIPDTDMHYFHATEKGKTLAFHGARQHAD